MIPDLTPIVYLAYVGLAVVVLGLLAALYGAIYVIYLGIGALLA